MPRSTTAADLSYSTAAARRYLERTPPVRPLVQYTMVQNCHSSFLSPIDLPDPLLFWGDLQNSRCKAGRTGEYRNLACGNGRSVWDNMDDSGNFLVRPIGWETYKLFLKRPDSVNTSFVRLEDVRFSPCTFNLRPGLRSPSCDPDCHFCYLGQRQQNECRLKTGSLPTTTTTIIIIVVIFFITTAMVADC